MPVMYAYDRTMSGASGQVSGDVRRHNLSLVLGHIARTGGSSRIEIAESTGLTRGAVTALVQVLIDAGWLRETASVGGTNGRPRTRLELAADDFALLAVEMSPDSTRLLASTIGGDELHSAHVDHRAADADAVLRSTAALLEDALERLRNLGRAVADLTVVVLAPVGGSPTRLIADAVPGWRNVDVLGKLRQLVPALNGIHMQLSTDAPLAAGAELRRREGVRNAIYIKGDSNIGGALIVEGSTVKGEHGFAGSLGHIAVVPDGEVCACGQRGCLITVAGVPSLLHSALLADELGSLTPAAALEEFAARVLAGDPAASYAWSAAAPWIGRALRILTMAMDPQIIVIGAQWALLVDSIRSAFEDGLPSIAAAPEFHVPVVAGVLGDRAGMLGAVETARDRVIRNPLALLR